MPQWEDRQIPCPTQDHPQAALCKLRALKEELRRRRHLPMEELGKWLRSAELSEKLRDHRESVLNPYALRDMSKPMGAAAYCLTQALAERLKSELPASEGLAAELPLLDFLTLRIQFEKKLAQMAKQMASNGSARA